MVSFDNEYHRVLHIWMLPSFSCSLNDVTLVSLCYRIPSSSLPTASAPASLQKHHRHSTISHFRCKASCARGTLEPTFRAGLAERPPKERRRGADSAEVSSELTKPEIDEGGEAAGDGNEAPAGWSTRLHRPKFQQTSERGVDVITLNMWNWTEVSIWT